MIQVSTLYLRGLGFAWVQVPDNHTLPQILTYHYQQHPYFCIQCCGAAVILGFRFCWVQGLGLQECRVTILSRALGPLNPSHVEPSALLPSSQTKAQEYLAPPATLNRNLHCS